MLRSYKSVVGISVLCILLTALWSYEILDPSLLLSQMDPYGGDDVDVSHSATAAPTAASSPNGKPQPPKISTSSSVVAKFPTKTLSVAAKSAKVSSAEETVATQPEPSPWRHIKPPLPEDMDPLYYRPVSGPDEKCASFPCIQGVCVPETKGYHCICPPGYSGARCEKKFPLYNVEWTKTSNHRIVVRANGSEIDQFDASTYMALSEKLDKVSCPEKGCILALDAVDWKSFYSSLASNGDPETTCPSRYIFYSDVREQLTQAKYTLFEGLVWANLTGSSFILPYVWNSQLVAPWKHYKMKGHDPLPLSSYFDLSMFAPNHFVEHQRMFSCLRSKIHDRAQKRSEPPTVYVTIYAAGRCVNDTPICPLFIPDFIDPTSGTSTSKNPPARYCQPADMEAERGRERESGGWARWQDIKNPTHYLWKRIGPYAEEWMKNGLNDSSVRVVVRSRCLDLRYYNIWFDPRHGRFEFPPFRVSTEGGNRTLADLLVNDDDDIIGFYMYWKRQYFSYLTGAPLRDVDTPSFRFGKSLEERREKQNFPVYGIATHLENAVKRFRTERMNGRPYIAIQWRFKKMLLSFDDEHGHLKSGDSLRPYRQLRDQYFQNCTRSLIEGIRMLQQRLNVSDVYFAHDYHNVDASPDWRSTPQRPLIRWAVDTIHSNLSVVELSGDETKALGLTGDSGYLALFDSMVLSRAKALVTAFSFQSQSIFGSEYRCECGTSKSSFTIAVQNLWMDAQDPENALQYPRRPLCW